LFKGSIIALITPFTSESEVDYENLKELVNWHIEEGSQGIVCCGTTGECPVLSDQERVAIIKTVVETARHRVPVIAGTGTFDTRTTVKNSIQAKELGVDGCLVVVPYYNCPTLKGCFLHYREVSKLEVPIIVYHHPKRTGVSLPAQALAEICHYPSIVGIKEASASLDLSQELICSFQLPVLSGNDLLTHSIMKMGAIGTISAAGNIFPKLWRDFIESFIKQDTRRGEEIYALCTPLLHALFLETNPQGVKYALSLMGKSSSHLRLPLTEPDETTKWEIFHSLSKLIPSQLKQQNPSPPFTHTSVL